MVSDHACCRAETKFGDPADDVFLAKSGSGDTGYLLAGLISDGRKRGLPLQRTQLVSCNPSRRFGLHTKGHIAQGYDAGFCFVDPDRSRVARAQDSQSTQEYTPFEGFELTAQVTDTVLAGQPVQCDGRIVGQPRGRYLHRPTQPSS